MRLVILIALLGFSCAKKGAEISVIADPNIKQSLVFETNESETLVGLHKKALDKEFLLRSQMMEVAPAPMFQGLRGRIVAFKRIENELFMLEATQGHIVDATVDVDLILAKFNIVKEDDKTLFFDFNRGMSQLFYAADWRASDFNGLNPSTDLNSIDIAESFLDEVRYSNNLLYIKQVVQAKVSFLGRMNFPYQVYYYLSPYAPDKSYKAKKHKDFKTFGFFETAPVWGLDDFPISYSTRFHPEKPIVFHVSANTPKDYVEAVKRGILYWNQAFGKEVLKAEMAPEGVHAPHPQYNIVQWIDWESAGFAFADAQMDPRTGQILNAQVFMTSVFADIDRIRALARKNASSEDKHSHFKVSLKGFSKEQMCNRPFDKRFLKTFKNMTKELKELPEERIKEVSRDFVSMIVAHEVGHTLGLRHNFAGSTAVNYSLSDRAENFKKYLHDKVVSKDSVFTSSIMEYGLFEEEAMLGHQTHTHKTVPEYDKKVIEHLYLGKKYERSEVPAFCTDSANALYVDCQIFDVGASSVEYIKWGYESEQQSFAQFLLEEFIYWKNPVGGEPKKVEEVELAPISDAQYTYWQRYQLLETIKSKGKIFKIQRQFPYVGELNKEEVKTAELDYLQSEVERLGGFAELLKAPENQFVDQTFDHFSELLETDAYSQGIINGKPFEFSAEEKALMKKIVKRYLTLYQKEQERAYLALLTTDLAYMLPSMKNSKDGLFLEHTLSENLLSFFVENAKKYLFEKTDKVITAQVTIEVPSKDKKKPSVKKVITVTLPEYAYDYKMRTQAAKLIKSDRFDPLLMGVYEMAEVKGMFEKEMKELFDGVELGKLEVTKLPRQVGKWVMENKKVLEAL